MYPIEFRAWGKRTKCFLNKTEYGLLLGGELIARSQYNEVGVQFAYTQNSSLDFILMQYTGVKDKNGIKLYDGDIIKLYTKKLFSKEYDVQVLEIRHSELNNNWGGFVGDEEITTYGIHIFENKQNYPNMENTLEKIGDIYTTPELRPVKKTEQETTESLDEEESEFCNCPDPQYETDEHHSQEGGVIVSRRLGEFCTNCGKGRAPKEPQTEE